MKFYGTKISQDCGRRKALRQLKSGLYQALFEVTRAVKRGGEDTDTNFLLRVALNNVETMFPRQHSSHKRTRKQGDNILMWSMRLWSGGVAIFVETSTDNVTRTVALLLFWEWWNPRTNWLSAVLFDHKSVPEVPLGELDEDDFMLK